VQVYQLLAHGRWFSPGTPASSTTKYGRHDIAESGAKQNKIQKYLYCLCVCIGLPFVPATWMTCISME
jgi:hypothetical protein